MSGFLSGALFRFRILKLDTDESLFNIQLWKLFKILITIWLLNSLATEKCKYLFLLKVFFVFYLKEKLNWKHIDFLHNGSIFRFFHYWIIFLSLPTRFFFFCCLWPINVKILWGEMWILTIHKYFGKLRN